MNISITTAGVEFDFPDSVGPAVMDALNVAHVCGWKLRGISNVGGNRTLVKISRTRNAAWEREMFARRLVSECGFRGIEARIV